MMNLPRLYDAVLAEHLQSNRQMVFLTGPRQVGKTTVARRAGQHYLDWDNRNHQQLILKGPDAVAEHVHLHVAAAQPPVVVFDELHKFARWKNFLKGFFDTYEDRCKVVVTGSARMEVYRRGGDSLVGRYFSYRMHPLSVGELVRSAATTEPIAPPHRLDDDRWEALLRHGGFPEPYARRDDRFTLRWRAQRNERLIKEDLKDLTRVHEFSLLEILARMLAERSGEQVVYAHLASDVQVAPLTVKGWVNTLVSMHQGFLVRPWHRNVSKALRKEPKWYLRDWSGLRDVGARAETLVACHLLKAVDYWTDSGLGVFELFYLRDKQKREVDFLVVRDDAPWFLVEVKQKETSLSPALAHFQKQIKAPHAFQVVLDLPYADVDCFRYTTPVVVSARTFLSQLI